MHKKRFLATAAVAVSIPLLLAGCVGGSTPTPRASTTPSLSGEQPAPQSTVVVPQPETTEGIEAANTPSGFAKQAAVAFPQAQATANFTKSEVQQAAYTAQQFAQASLNSPTFISGAYAQNGYQPDTAIIFNNFLSDTGLQHLRDIMGKVQQKDDNAANQLFSLVLWYPAGGSNYQTCSAKAIICQPEGYPKLANYTYAEGSDGSSIEISFKAESRVLMTVDGVKGYVPVTNDMSFRLVKQADYTGGPGTYPFAIDGWNTKYVSERWTH